MSMGVKCAAQQCHHAFTPDSFTGGQVDTAEMPSGMHPQQFLGQRKNAEMSFHTYPRGANHDTQKCYVRCAPDIFIWCQGKTAEMLLPLHTKGRVNATLQKCQCLDTLPNQLKGSL
jgi:hypothetical protein